MNIQVLVDVDTTYLNRALLDENGRMRLMPAEYFKEIPLDHLRIWANKNARYQIVTKELIDFLRGKIAGRTAIEVGAGMGDVGFHLGIRMTDSCIQTTPEIAAHYASMGQPITRPPADVERLDAEQAVARYKPQVVVACWVTQKWREGDEYGSVNGVEERKVIDNCELYIHVGHDSSHGDKRVRKIRHASLRFPWLVTRSADQSKNVIYLWGE